MVDKRDPILPRFPTAGGPQRGRGAGRPGARGPEGAAVAAHAGRRAESAYWERLEREIGVIQSMGFSGYFLIVSDFMKWAVAHGHSGRARAAARARARWSPGR